MPIYRKVPLERLMVDPRYQRDINESHVKKMTEDFDEALFGTLEISERSNGNAAVFDGQHRLLVARNRTMTYAPCLVHTGLTPQQEADLFRRLQDGRKPLTTLDRFKARLFAGDPRANGVAKIVGEHDIEIGTGPRSIQGITYVERVYIRGNLEETLDMLSIWRGDSKWLDGSLIDGLSRFLDLYQEADRARCRQLWAEVSPTTIIRRSTEFMATAHSSKAYGVLEVVRSLVASRKFPLPSVEKAQAARVEQRRAEGGRRYRRLELAEVRDTFYELSDHNPDVKVTIDMLQDKLECARRPLTKRGGFIDQLLKMGTIARKKEGSGGTFYYVYVRPHQQRSRLKSQRQSNGNGRGPRGRDKAVPRTGKPQFRPGTRDKRTRAKA